MIIMIGLKNKKQTPIHVLKKRSQQSLRSPNVAVNFFSFNLD